MSAALPFPRLCTAFLWALRRRHHGGPRGHRRSHGCTLAKEVVFATARWDVGESHVRHSLLPAHSMSLILFDQGELQAVLFISARLSMCLEASRSGVAGTTGVRAVRVVVVGDR